jgi:hypothetical protein
MDRDDDYLRRYTDIPALIHLLKYKKLTLLDPGSWDDRNDSYYLSVYKEKKSLKSVLALCFTEVSETYHHWKIFAGGSSGVCIKFNREALFTEIEQLKYVRFEKVKYLTLDDIRNEQPTVDELPFIKRYAFQDEREYRMVYESSTKEIKIKNIPIPLECIEKITLSPWMHKSLSIPLKRTLSSIIGDTPITMVRSTRKLPCQVDN